jgi:hypothetical protein
MDVGAHLYFQLADEPRDDEYQDEVFQNEHRIDF